MDPLDEWPLIIEYVRSQSWWCSRFMFGYEVAEILVIDAMKSWFALNDCPNISWHNYHPNLDNFE